LFLNYDNSLPQCPAQVVRQFLHVLRRGILLLVNLSISSDLRVILGKKGIKDIIYLRNPDASLNPKEKLSRRALFLKGFHNYEYLRPQTKMDIFRWDG